MGPAKTAHFPSLQGFTKNDISLGWIQSTSLHQARQCSRCHGSNLPQIGVFLGPMDLQWTATMGPLIPVKCGTMARASRYPASNISMTRRTSGRRSLGFNWRLGIFANGLEMARVSESLHTPNETNENNENRRKRRNLRPTIQPV